MSQHDLNMSQHDSTMPPTLTIKIDLIINQTCFLLSVSPKLTMTYKHFTILNFFLVSSKFHILEIVSFSLVLSCCRLHISSLVFASIIFWLLLYLFLKTILSCILHLPLKILVQPWTATKTLHLQTVFFSLLMFLTFYLPYFLTKKYYMLLTPLVKICLNALLFVLKNFHIFLFTFIIKYYFFFLLLYSLKINVRNILKYTFSAFYFTSL